MSLIIFVLKCLCISKTEMYISSFEVKEKLAETTASEVVPEIMTLLYILRIHFLHMVKSFPR